MYHGIVVGAGASRFQITDNRIGDVVGTAGNPHAYGVFVSAGASNNYIIANNNCQGNTSGGVADGGTGATARVQDNIGYNPGWAVSNRSRGIAVHLHGRAHA